MKMPKLLLLTTLAATSVRCSDIDYKDRTADRKTATLGADESFQVKIEGLPEPNHFKAVLQYSGPNPGQWTILKKSNSAAAKLTSFEFKDTRSGPLEDLDLQAGETYEYQIGKKENDGDEFQIAKTEKVTVEPDLVINGLVNIQDLQKSDRISKPIFRIYFTKDSILKTNGQDLDLQTTEIFSDNGRVQTFSDPDTATLGTDGKPSGHIHLKVERITGPLTIEIRGQKGGEGFRGATGPQGSLGPPSSKPPLDHAQWIGRNIFCSREFYDPPTKSVCFGKSYEDCRMQYHPGIGGKGGTGGQGFQGLPGFRGGDAQSSSLEFPMSDNIKLIFAPGAGGIGGHGGDGGPGGPGGPPTGEFNTPSGYACDPFPNGPIGDTGPEGPQGPTGLPGNKEILTVNNEVLP